MVLRIKRQWLLGHLGGSVVELLPLAQVMIWGPGIEFHIQVPIGNLLLPLPMSLPLSLCVSLMNKNIQSSKKKKKRENFGRELGALERLPHDYPLSGIL